MNTSNGRTARTIAVVGHKGSGKTSLIEAMQYVARASTRLGRVADGTSVFDDSPEERMHHATFESRVATLEWGEATLHVIDTPGEGGFAADTLHALAVADAALLVISARDGVQSGTERLYRWIRESGLPCVAVLTHVEDEGVQIDEVVSQASARLAAHVDPVEVVVGSGAKFRGVVSVERGMVWTHTPEGPSEAPSGEVPAESRASLAAVRAHLVDDVAGTDDALADKYLADGDLSPADLESGLRADVAKGSIVPLFLASGVLPAGIGALLDGLVELVPTPAERRPYLGTAGLGSLAEETRASDRAAPLSLFVFKTRVDPHVGRIAFARVLSGVLHPDANVVDAARDQTERVGHLLAVASREGDPLPEAVAGDLVAITRLKSVHTGDTLSDPRHPFVLTRTVLPQRLFSRAVSSATRGAEEKLVATLVRLAEEDPGLEITHDPEGHAVVVSGLGSLHLEVTAERVRRRSGVACVLGAPHIPFRETITRAVAHIEGKQKKQSGGHGQFAVCVIDVAPLPRGAGFVFEDATVGGVIPRTFVGSVEKGVKRAMARGVLAGHPLVDLKVRLTDGKTHAVDSSDAAFQAAGYKALRAAAEQAAPTILQPVMKVRVRGPAAAMGELLGDIGSRGGHVVDTDASGSDVEIVAFLPLSATLEYEPRLKGLTQGRGTFAAAFDHYEACSPAAQERIVRESAFVREKLED